MKIVALAKRRPEVAVETMRPHFKAEIEAVWGLYAQGIVREFYARADQGGPAVLTLESETVENARQALARLPLVEMGLLELDLIPLAPFTNLAQLFGNGAHA